MSRYAQLLFSLALMLILTLNGWLMLPALLICVYIMNKNNGLFVYNDLLYGIYIAITFIYLGYDLDQQNLIYMIKYALVSPLLIVIFYLLAGSICRSDDQKNFIRSVLILLFAFLLYSYFIYKSYLPLNEFVVYDVKDIRIFGMNFDNVDVYWHYAGSFMYICLYYILRFNKKNNLLLLISLPFILFSGSRGMIIIMILSIIFLKPRIVLSISALFIFFGLSQYISFGDIGGFYFDRFLNFDNELYVDYSIDGARFSRWQFFLDNLNKVNTFSSTIYRPTNYSYHNYVMDAMVSRGYFGGLLATLFLINILYLSINKQLLWLGVLIIITVLLGLPSGSNIGLIFYSVILYSQSKITINKSSDNLGYEINPISDYIRNDLPLLK